jgi:cell division GTPase FtsZ
MLKIITKTNLKFMNRREYIKTLLKGTFLMFFSPILAKTEHSKKVIYIGLGGAGTNMLFELSKNIKNANCISINNKLQDNWDKDVQFVRFKSSLTDENNAQDFVNLSRNIPAEISAIFKDGYSYKILVGLGGQTGTLLALMIDRYFKHTSIDYEIYATIPFQFETKKKEIANTILTILHFGKNTIAFDLEHFKNKWGNITFQHFFKKVNKLVINAIVTHS